MKNNNNENKNKNKNKNKNRNKNNNKNKNKNKNNKIIRSSSSGGSVLAIYIQGTLASFCVSLYQYHLWQMRNVALFSLSRNLKTGQNRCPLL